MCIIRAEAFNKYFYGYFLIALWCSNEELFIKWGYVFEYLLESLSWFFRGPRRGT